ncbi:metal-dependent hydrolase [uncultured Cocleimonas sp.]|uniref:metal-dependent hydrolase n=1 Tax=uncultured Cocleimonas sp. TaxID=1051587 RepID=UPI0026366E88|nr:metal-dependent hydrolase [uncultured Cocleimonas sp.]
MDPITQGAFGAVFAQTQGNAKNLAKAAVIGALAGMAPDLDILIRSDHDPLQALQYHRHFTHSLLFIPIGGLICSLVLHPTLGRWFGVPFWQTLFWCIIGYATHGLLDGCTSYGTQLLWPLTDKRFAWDVISVVDPLVTLPLLAMVILAARRKARRYVAYGFIWVGLYFGLSTYQHSRALEEGEKLAASRGLKTLSIEAKPSFANILIWKIITETESSYHVDAIRIGLNESKIWEGDSVEKLSIEKDLPWLDKQSQQRKDIERFRWFSTDYIALDKQNPNRVVDIRYSLLPQQIKPLWGIELSRTAKADEHVDYYHERGDSGAAIKLLWGMFWD